VSQQVKIIGYKATGRVYLGELDADDGSKYDYWSSNPLEIVQWLCHGYRGRFNDRRALRRKYVYRTDPNDTSRKTKIPLLDMKGQPVLKPIGKVPGTDETRKECKTTHPHWSAVPDLLLLHATASENTEWFSATKRRATNIKKGTKAGDMPGFRFKRDDLKFSILCDKNKDGSPKNAKFTKTGKRSGVVTITGINPTGKYEKGQARWSLKIRVRLSQEIREYTSVVVNFTKGVLTFVSPVPTEYREPTGKTAGGDLGVTRTIALSDGQFFDKPDTSELDKKIKNKQRAMSRKRQVNNPTNAKGWKPSNAYLKVKQEKADLQAKKTRILTDWRHKTTTTIIKEFDQFFIEDLQVKNMMASAKGTVENPGKNVKQKSGLNRGLAGSAFGEIRSMFEYKSEKFGTYLGAVNAKNSSRECHKCHHISKRNRESQAIFKCRKCGYTENADTQASKVIHLRGLAQTGQDIGRDVSLQSENVEPGKKLSARREKTSVDSLHKTHEPSPC